ncbi:MAG: hypothetical protein IPM17_15955 [Verrucomicrobia bacterium]|nr:hypothetical protein [Verrucomicrobiota bacterium]
MKKSKLLIATGLGLLSAAALNAQSTVVLESFEDSIDSVTLMNWGGRPALDPPGVVLEQYTRSDETDAFVTHGQKSLKVTLSGQEWWSADFKITLSEEAAAKVREAAQSTDLARYILRWDVVFPPSGTTHWMNSQLQGFGGVYDQVDSNNGQRTMSVALDLINPLPEEGPLELIFAQNFDAIADPFESLDLYVDNIRLVDTYAPGATPKVYVLQSFEDPNDPTGGAANFTGWGGGQRTTYEQYTKQDAEDIRVSEGDHALQVNYSGAGGWGSDFIIPFTDTKLAEVLKLDLPPEERPSKAELARYTLRWETTYPPRGDDWTADWQNTSYHTLQDGLPWSQSGAFDTRKTYSITLDQINWADWSDPKPVLMFIANGAWGESGHTLWFDNFRLIDTGDVGQTPAPKITAFTYNAQTRQISITWESVAGKLYAIDSTENLGSWPTVLAANLTGQAGTTTYTATMPVNARTFLRVRATN